ncbi:UDP-N-acetylglucosamine 2-epimerase [Paenibacillus sp. HN-1]|uniref:MGDG synthase family glycosyltransferase n=1 Tax=Paenibacillus TaxID=44249 RepID=UPI001CA8C227|nr:MULTISPECIES: glycosyltransferase [Paenibacillus]MBY9078188.1 UDP-N-acetylglucosamine 2-epimerase [Paenibacillus sp. CGMCC 1.18879]MBY9086153.1 UDP-N-acetylglucosamine 2-epimerase [Paenibacillus sinensis]
MNRTPAVLIVTSKFGDGHVKAAEAIKQAFEAQGIDQVHIVDLFAEVFPRLNELSRRFYLNNSSFAQELYGFIYETTSKMKPDRTLGKLLHSLGKMKVRRLLDQLRPDLIIHTFPYLAAAQISGEAGSQVPVFTVLTDYVVHGRWVHPYTTKYFTASSAMKQDLQAVGVPGENIVVSGIPIRQRFTQLLNREETLREHGLDSSRRYFLLAAGAYGVLSNIGGLIRSILDNSDYDLIAVCGNNHKLRAAMEAKFNGDHRVHVLGYTDRMPELMSFSDGLLTKAGGITLTEAMAKSLPVIVYRPLPGQEAGNARWLAGRNLIDVAKNEEELIAAIRRLEQPVFREERKRVMREYAGNCSSELIVDEALRALELRQPVRQSSPEYMEGQAKTAHGY